MEESRVVAFAVCMVKTPLVTQQAPAWCPAESQLWCAPLSLHAYCFSFWQFHDNIARGIGLSFSAPYVGILTGIILYFPGSPASYSPVYLREQEQGMKPASATAVPYIPLEVLSHKLSAARNAHVHCLLGRGEVVLGSVQCWRKMTFLFIWLQHLLPRMLIST